MKISPCTPLKELPQFLTVEEFRAVTRIGRSTLYDLVRREEIHAVRFGRVLRIPREVLQQYLSLNGNSGGRQND